MNSADKPQSVLFADVLGSARLYDKLGSSEAAKAVERCLKRMQRAVDAYGGRTRKTVGDELMAVFNAADEAFHAAIEMQQRVADLLPVSGVKLAIRVGFAHGSVSEDVGGIVGEAVNNAVHLAGLAKPGQVLTSLEAQAALSPELKKSTREPVLAAAKGKSPGMIVFEVVAPETSSAAATVMDAPAENAQGDRLPGDRLALRYAGEVIVLDDRRPVINMGRDAKSDVVIKDRRASRHHARIEWQGDKILLIDTSTNGTFVTLTGKPELFLRHGECVIHGKGVICFADSATSPDADCAEFELI